MIPTQSVPKHAADDIEIAQLTDLYQAQLVELQAAHSLLLADQERLAELLAPHLTPSGAIAPDALQQLDPKVLLFKDGLDLRVAEFQEDCKRIQATERRLQNKIERAAEDYERNFLQSSGLVDARVLKRVREQQRVIQIQQGELDQLRFEKDILQAENRRLKELCIHQPDYAFKAAAVADRNAVVPLTLPSFHSVNEANQRPLFGTNTVLHESGVPSAKSKSSGGSGPAVSSSSGGLPPATVAGTERVGVLVGGATNTSIGQEGQSGWLGGFANSFL